MSGMPTLRSTIRAVAAAIDKRLNPSDVRSFCAVVAIINLAGMIVAFVSASTNHNQTAFGVPLGADFPAFYDAGTVINRYGAAKLYDISLQARIYHEQFPLADVATSLPFVNAPVLALPLPFLSRLAYPSAYALWLLLSIALYVGGFRLLWSELKGMPGSSYGTALLIAVTFMPFMGECLSGGQTTAIGFFCLAAALTLEARGQMLASGCMLSLVMYKPTLLLLICPMLMLTGRWRTIAGLMLGSTLLALVSIATYGWNSLSGWLGTLAFAGRNATSIITGLRTWKFVDINSFARGLAGSHPAIRWIIVGVSLSILLPWVVRAWRTMRNGNDVYPLAAWAVTLAWLPVLNLYVGFYDAALLGLSVMLTTDQLYRRSPELPPGYRLLLLALYVIPWCSQPIARSTGVQLYTLVIAGWGVYVLLDVRRRRHWREMSGVPDRLGPTRYGRPVQLGLAPGR